MKILESNEQQMEDYADVDKLRAALKNGEYYILQTGWFYDVADWMTNYVNALPLTDAQKRTLIQFSNRLAKEAQVGGFLCGYSHHSGAAKYGLKARFSAKKEAER